MESRGTGLRGEQITIGALVILIGVVAGVAWVSPQSTAQKLIQQSQQSASSECRYNRLQWDVFWSLSSENHEVLRAFACPMQQKMLNTLAGVPKEYRDEALDRSLDQARLHR